ncbi:glycosyltransferase [Bacteroides stercorirosoris]|uniref:Glycosyltransferase involved in cell wall bisynthesis n=1 Tax=Bacteroides stercorirosoris TaxID=871324 RepID=A0A1M6HZ92_9BACE|nr:glycosyltransferase [Bacteroides stercorirosoris]SHJ27512.1 Glycosyltransferase involved in cell wall bisynthesis [Bacteroides stercorirosoris]
MKKILFVSAFVPCDKTAGQNYTRLLLTDLLKSNTVDLICFDAAHHQLDLYCKSMCRKIEVYSINNINRMLGCIQLPFFHPFFVSRFNIFIAYKLYKMVHQEKYDWVYLDFSQSFVYGLFLHNTSKILMCHDVISQYYLRKKSILNYKWVLRTEKRIFSQNNVTLFSFSEKDRAIIVKQYGLSSLVTSFYICDSIINLPYPAKVENWFTFYGAWNRLENEESLSFFLDEIYPLLDVKILIKVVGGGLSNDLQEKIKREANIDYVGFVDNPYEYLSKSKALIAPLKKGAGVKVKVVEAIACGCPIIGTDVAFEGISEKFSDMMFCAHSPLEYKSIIESINVSFGKRQYNRDLMISHSRDKVIIEYMNKNKSYK